MLMDLDRTDRRILKALQHNARITNQDLADSVGLSPSPCLRRVKQLENAGLILEYVAILDAQKLDLGMMALVQINLDKQIPERFNSFEATLSQFPEVIECLLITGQSADYQIKVIVKDLDAYQQFLLGKLTQIEGVTAVHSSFVLRKVINHNRIPI